MEGNSKQFMQWFLPLFVIALSACSHLENGFRDPVETATFPLTNASLRVINELSPGCLDLFKSFCKSLYSPGTEGAMKIPLPDGALEIRRGKTDNDFSFAYFEYARTQIKFRNRLPVDFRAVLNRKNYFPSLRTYLERKPRSRMTMEERTSVIALAHEIEATWNAAIEETVLHRMEKRFPGTSKLREDLIPTELKNESKRVRGTLISEIAQAVWREHPNWKRVEEQFNQVREAFRDVISNHPRIPSDVKIDWLQRINSPPLIIPGSDPQVTMLACSTTEENAYYDPSRNYLTICAGDFNSEDMIHTIAHELAHTLDVFRSRVLFEEKSELGKQLETLRQQSCSKTAKFSCSKWENFKSDFPAYVESLEAFNIQVPEFQACLKGGTSPSMPDNYITRVAREEVQDTLSTLAERNVFLRMITPSVPLSNGTVQKNQMFLNPCGYYLWDHAAGPIESDYSLLLFFNDEYRCTDHLPNEIRFQQSLETAVQMQRQLVESRIRMEREFSPRSRLVADGYAASPIERFADTLSSMVFAHILRKEKDLAKRRATYLANNAWLCQEPSLPQLLPTEAGILKKYYVEPHSENSVRQKEVLQKDIRDALECKLDFDIKECKL